MVDALHIRPRAVPLDLKSKIRAAFARNAQLDADQVTVEVADGAATLRADVTSWAERAEAERVVWAAPGISAVKNQLNVVSRALVT